ncbi:MAG: starch-binding protein, partial [Muribaculaceae bacterium]|nr:starch-binding protein [Muribaculaceae bacterium]
AKEGDHFYNDASWNVVYVDSHDYAPQPNDDKRFAGGTEQWAENLSMMFTFRGIPCLYYGSEVEFQKGATIDKGPLLALKESGRAYFGAYLEGDVQASDFGKIANASGNVEKTLDGDLSQHIRRLNMIRQAVPALRKGQYTWDGCAANGGFAFKRAYKDSYALVAVNGGATFSNVPAGTYTDLVTGKTYQGGGSITVDAPKNKGQLRVLVKDWTGGKVGEDGKFIYTTSPVAHGGSVSFTDPGTTEYYTKEDAEGPTINGVKFSPAGGSFRTETQTVSVTLESGSVAGWYQVEGKDKVSLTSGSVSTFTIGEGMEYGQTVSVNWSATDIDGKTAQGQVSYKKIDPNAAITIYVKAPNGGNIYVWGTNSSGVEEKPAGAWPGKAINSLEKVGDFYSFTVADIESVNVIFNGNGQTGDITGITEDVYYEYDGATTATKLENGNVTPQASVTFSPNGGVFTEDEITVTATAKNAVSSWYKIGDGTQQNFSNTAQFKIGEGMENNDQVTVSWSATNSEGTVKSGSVTFTKKVIGGGDDPVEPTGNLVVYYDNSKTNWNTVNIHYWGGESATEWPGEVMTSQSDCGCYYYELPEGTTGVIFHNGSGTQTDDITPVHNTMYVCTGSKQSSSSAHGHNGDDPIPPTPVDPTDGFVIYFDNSVANFGKVMAHYWGGASASTWPGAEMRKLDCGHYSLSLPANTTGLVVNNNDQGDQTVDITPVSGNLYLATNDMSDGKRNVTYTVHSCIPSAVGTIYSEDEAPVEIYNLQGMR